MNAIPRGGIRAFGLAEWALSQSDAKYRPTGPITPDYHRVEDARSQALTRAKAVVEAWRQGGRKLTHRQRLSTRLLNGDDLKVIFNGWGIADGDFNWIAKALHDKTRGPDLATFTGKVVNAHSLTTTRATINHAFTIAEQNHLIAFPGPW